MVTSTYPLTHKGLSSVNWPGWLVTAGPNPTLSAALIQCTINCVVTVAVHRKLHNFGHFLA